MNKKELKQKYGGGKNYYLCWPVTFADQGEDEEHHLTCKFLGPVSWLGTPEMAVKQTVQCLEGLDTRAPDRDKITWEPHTFKTYKDGDVKVLLLHNCSSSVFKCHDALDQIRKDDYPEFKPHITVKEDLWEAIKEHGFTPQEVGISFGRLQLRQGDEVLFVWPEAEEQPAGRHERGP